LNEIIVRARCGLVDRTLIFYGRHPLFGTLGIKVKGRTNRMQAIQFERCSTNDDSSFTEVNPVTSHKPRNLFSTYLYSLGYDNLGHLEFFQ